MTQKNVPPKTMANEGTSMNGPTPPPETIAYIINLELQLIQEERLYP